MDKEAILLEKMLFYYYCEFIDYFIVPLNLCIICKVYGGSIKMAALVNLSTNVTYCVLLRYTICDPLGPLLLLFFFLHSSFAR